jgi:hypothetical protein
VKDLAHAFVCSKISSRARPFEISFRQNSDDGTSADGTRAPNEAQVTLNIVPPMGTGLPNERRVRDLVGRCFLAMLRASFYLSVLKDMGCRRQNDKGCKED